MASYSGHELDEPSGPTVRFTSDGTPTPEFLAWIELRTTAATADAEELANHGLALFQRGERHAGIETLLRAFKLGNAIAGFNVGTIYWQNRQVDFAKKFWRGAAAMGDVDAMVGLVRLALRSGDHAAARPWIDPVLARDEPFPITALALEFKDAGDLVTARRALTRAASLDYQPAAQHFARLDDW